MLYDLQNRPEFHRRVLSAGWRYHWRPQNHHDQYQFDLIDLNYVFMPWISETFRHEYLDNTSNYNAILRYNYEDLFIMKIGFGWVYNNGVIAVKTNLETAGNLLNVGSHLFNAEQDDRGQYRVFNIAYAQYVPGVDQNTFGGSFPSDILKSIVAVPAAHSDLVGKISD